MEARAVRLRYFSYPIYFVSIFIGLAQPIVENISQNNDMLDSGNLRPLRATLWLILMVPGIAIVLYDMRRLKPITFSHAHCGFLMTVLLGTTQACHAWIECRPLADPWLPLGRTVPAPWLPLG